MKTLKLLVACVCGLLVLSGCQNPLQRPQVAGDAGMGILLLSLDRPGARTILPDFDFAVGDFYGFELAFENADDPGDTRLETFARGDLEDGVFTLALPVGSWNLIVTAFLPDAVAAARGSSANPVEITQGGFTPVAVELFPIDDGDDPGTFGWVIAFPNVENAYRLRLRIWPWLIGEAPDFGQCPVFSYWFDIPAEAIILTGNTELNAGQYFVIFELHRETDNGSEHAETSAILHVASSLASRFYGDDATFTPADFPSNRKQLLDVILGAWDATAADGSGAWDFSGAGIRPGHFALLGIGGVTEADFHADNSSGIIYWLNYFTRDPAVAFPESVEELRELIDLALDSLAETLAVQLEALRVLVAEGANIDAPHVINIGRSEQVSSYATSLEAFEGMNITIILEGTGTAHAVRLLGTGSLFDIPYGVTLELRGNVTLRGVDNNDAALVVVRGGGTLVMNAGATITGNNNTGEGTHGGGGVLVESGAVFHMHGGSIVGNTTCEAYNAWGGAGVHVRGSFFLNDGTISGNTAIRFGGGGVLVDGSFTMRGGYIQNNISTTEGGGVTIGRRWIDTAYVGGTFTMEGGTISGNIADGWGGGGVFVGEYGEFTMTGGSITGNNTPNTVNNDYYGVGGGVAIGAGGTFTMNNGTISDNTAENGGGVFVGGNLGVDDVPVVGRFYMNNGTISDNTADYWGGGVNAGWHGVFTMSGGNISGNTAAIGGGGVYTGWDAEFTMSGGAVFGNTADEVGASVFVNEDGGTARYAGAFAVYGDYILTSDIPLPYRRGAGTADDPFRIFNEAQLHMVGSGQNGWLLDSHYRLMANITLTRGWVPIGAHNHPIISTFNGTFDGNFHVITGLTITDSPVQSQGMFSILGGPSTVVRNLGLVDVTIRTAESDVQKNIGGIAGRVVDGARIESVFVTGRIEARITRLSTVGGIAGTVINSEVRNVYSTADIIDATNAFTSTGGIAGQLDPGGLVEYSFATGTVTATPLGRTGGIVGLISDLGASGTVQHSVALNPTISGQSGSTHRIVGIGGITQNNFARNDMLVNGSVVTVGESGATLHGSRIDHTAWNSGGTGGFWASLEFDPDVWDTANGRLPILRGFAPEVQNPTVPPIFTEPAFTFTIGELRDWPENSDIEMPEIVGLLVPRRITITGNFDSIVWLIGTDEIPAGSLENEGATLVLDSRIHNNQTGRYRVTVVVEAGGRAYSRVLAFYVGL